MLRSSIQRDNLMNYIIDIARDRLHQRTVTLVHLLVNAHHIVLRFFDPIQKRCVLQIELLSSYLLLIVVSVCAGMF